MAAILSIDPAYRKASDFGVCLLTERKGKLETVRFVSPDLVEGFIVNARLDPRSA
jgi:hypothetical protein